MPIAIPPVVNVKQQSSSRLFVFASGGLEPFLQKRVLRTPKNAMG